MRRQRQRRLDAAGSDEAFYVQPRFSEFERAPGLTYKAYADDDVTLALLDADTIYSREFTSLVVAPHYEFKFAPRSHVVYELAAVDADDAESIVVAWYRRPLQFSRTLRSFPWRPDDYITLFTRETNEAVLSAELLAYVERPDGSAATGYTTLELIEARAVDGLIGDLRRVSSSSIA